MRKGRKRGLVYLLAASMASAALTAGCQQSGITLAQTREEKEKPGAETKENAREGGEEMDNQNRTKGKTIQAEEPKKADISPENYEGWDKLLQDNAISDTFQKGLDQFAYKSGSAVLKEGKGNENYSPLSLYYTLALAGCGSSGETASQILENLGARSQEELADQCYKLYQWYVYKTQRDQDQMAHYGMEDYKSAIQLGNSLWISDQLAIREEYQRLAAEKFFASSYAVDFGNSNTGKQMGSWIAEKTNGVLEPQLSPDPGTLLAILNTLYFYGGWAEPFAPEMTQEDVFTQEDGTQVSVPFLNRTEMAGAFKKGDGYTLSYMGTNNNCQMVFLLPDKGRSVGEFLESPESLQAAMDVKGEDWASGKVIWKVPKFGFGSSYKLEDTLKAMGMDRMFDDRAEFGGISSDPLLVTSVIQETHIGLDEQGVEGAAYTMMAMARGAIPTYEEVAEMILDRPFLFGIRDNAHGSWLFLGVCRNPAEEGHSQAVGEE